MSFPSLPAPLRIAINVILIAVALAVIVHLLVGARRQRGDMELLRVENRLLDQENRLLRQQLEAERILAAAQARLNTASPAPAATP